MAVIGDFAQNGQVVFDAKGLGGVGAFDGFVDDDAERLVEKRHQLMHHLKVVCAEKGGLGNEQTKVGVFDALHDNAGATRRTVDDNGFVGCGNGGQQFFDNRNARGLTDMEHARIELHIICRARLHRADFFVGLIQRLLRAKQRTTAAGVADVVKNQQALCRIGQGVEVAKIDAGSASVAKSGVECGDFDANGFVFHLFRAKIKVPVGLLHIAIHIDGRLQQRRQIHGQQRFACTAFAAEYGYFHVISLRETRRGFHLTEKDCLLQKPLYCRLRCRRRFCRA